MPQSDEPDSSSTDNSSNTNGDSEELDAALHAAFQSESQKSFVETFDRTEKQIESGLLLNGRYRLLELIGEGGMGSVWLAEQKEPVKRRVAVKLVKAGMDSRSVLTRFEAERQALAMMDHPNIAKVLDGGVTEQGRPYFVMELVKGIPLTAYCDQVQFSIRERLELFGQVCSAVQHAHQKGIIHRDLKPSNVLVTEVDGHPVVKVIDFGLAKALHGSQVLTDQSLNTAFGSVMGTPLYMAPEQLGTSALDVDTRADLYSLGVILYELLTGTTPIERQQLKQAAYDEMCRLIREQEPIRPSTRLSSNNALPNLAVRRHVEPAKLARLVRGELDWIVMKALEKDRNRRYETANGLGLDIQRYLAGEAVLAAPPSRRYRIQKFIGKHRRLVGLAGFAIVLTLLAASVSLWQAMRATEASRRAQASELKAIQNERAATQAMQAERTARENEQRQRQLAEQQRAEAEQARNEAEQARKESEQQKSIAIAARNQALSTLDSMTSSLAGKYLTQQDQISSDQIFFLNGILDRYQEVLNVPDSDDEMGIYSTQALLRVAHIHHRLGNRPEMVQSYGQAISRLKELYSRRPEKIEWAEMLVGAYLSQGWGMWIQGFPDQASEAYQLGIELVDDLLNRQPTADRLALMANLKHNLALIYRDSQQVAETLTLLRETSEYFERANRMAGREHSAHNRALALGSLAIGESDWGDWSRSQEYFLAAARLFEEQIKIQPDEPRLRMDHAWLLTNFCAKKMGHGELQECIELGQKAELILADLILEFPSALDKKSEMMRCLQLLAIAFKSQNSYDLAKAKIEKCISIGEQITSRSPGTSEYRWTLARAIAWQARIEIDCKDNNSAASSFHRCLDLWKTLLTEDGDGTQFNLDLLTEVRDDASLASGLTDERSTEFWSLARLANRRILKQTPQTNEEFEQVSESLLLCNRCQGFAARKATDAALADLQPRLEQFQQAPICDYNLACCLAVIHAAMEDNDPSQETTALSAIAYLERAANSGWSNYAWALKDPDLDSLRDREDFKNWLEVMSKQN